MVQGSYNGWADMPEDEREALAAYEAGLAVTEAAREPNTPLRRIKSVLISPRAA